MDIQTELIGLCRDYLAVLNIKGDEEAALSALARTLDNLAAFYHRIPAHECDPNDDSTPPKRTPQKTRALVASCFPSLGYYNTALDISDDIATTSVCVGDSISDIAEIADDIAEILWYAEHTSVDNALFYYELGYRGHWGLHLRELQLYLHDLMW